MKPFLFSLSLLLVSATALAQPVFEEIKTDSPEKFDVDRIKKIAEKIELAGTKLDPSPRTEPVTLIGRIVEPSPGKFELIVKDIGRYDLSVPPSSNSDIDQSDLRQFVRNEDTTIIGKYTGNGVVEPLELSPDPDAAWASGTVKLSQTEQSMISEANEYRRRAGVPPLQVDQSLMNTARQHSANMARRRSMYHGGTSGWSGENVAWNQPTPQAVTLAWYNSPGHRRNMLNPRFTKIGVGEVNRYWTQQFK